LRTQRQRGFAAESHHIVFTGTARFRPIRHLGSGATGSVYLVHDQQLGREVALKTLNLSGGTDLYRFKREFRAVAGIDHPNLVTLHELISDGAVWFFTMDYVAGLPFDQYLIGRPAIGGPGVAESRVNATGDAPAVRAAPVRIEPERLLSSVRQLCAGVNAIHEIGCVHRDLKPTNVLVTESGRVVILDFGLLQRTGTSRRSSAGLSGTPAYMAPEQVLERPCLPAADWYAVGTMIYEVLTGRCPFEGALFEVLLRKQTEDPPSPASINPLADPLLSELCMRMLQRDVSLRPTGPEILARMGVTTGRQAQPPLWRHTPLGTVALRVPGRECELQALQAACARARKGNLAVVTVHGCSGIGKTCLVENFLEDLEGTQDGPTSAVVLRGYCHERETLPFKAFDHIVDGLSRQLASLSEDDLSYVLPDGILYLSEVFPVLRRLKLTEHPRYFLPPLRDLQELRNQAFVAFCELLRRLARLRPVVIFIDDLQWADRDSYSLLRALTQQPGAPSLLLIAAIRRVPEGFRPDPMLREFEAQPGIESIAIGPLSPDGTRMLIDNLLDGSELAPALRHRLSEVAIRESGGNPFFAVELVHHLRTLALPGAESSGQLDGRSYSLDAMILARVGALPKESQDLLQVVAVAGDPLPQRVLAAAAGLAFGEAEWERGISALLEQCLVRRSGRQSTDRIEPYHDRIRETVSASLDEASLHEVHLGLARAIEAFGSERPDLLARYWLSADDHERAKRYALEAAVEARGKLAFARAAELFQSVADLETDGVAQADLLRQVGECHASVGHARLAAELFQRAAALGDPRQSARLRHLAAEQLLRGGQIKQGLEVLGNVLAGAGLGYARHLGRAHLWVAIRILWLRLRGLKFRERPASEVDPRHAELLDILWSANTGLGVVDTLRADDFLLRFLLLALKTGDIRRVAQGLAVLGGQLAALGGGRFAWASRLVSEAEVLARRSAHPSTIGLARMCRAMVRYFAGEFSAAADDFFEVERFILSNCHGMGWELATTRSFACFSLRLCGRLRELCDRFDRYTADADRAGDRYLATNLRTYQSAVWLIRDAPERAALAIEGALDAWPADMYHVQHFFHLYGRCEQALYSEQPERAWEAITADERRLRDSGLLRVSGIRIENAGIRGRVALALAERAEPTAREPWLKVARESVGVLRKAEHQTGVAMGACLEAGICWVMPEADRARAIVALERAVATAEAAGALLLAESVRRWLGEIVGGRKGNETRARSNGWMADQGIQNPARLAHLYAPGFRTAGNGGGGGKTP
jgi:eukaryotic-like serine/threonine-protein kinase